MWQIARARRERYREVIPAVFEATAEMYYQQWGEFFHLAIFEPGENLADFDTAMERTHRRYFEALGGQRAERIVEFATGGGAFAEWMAERTGGEVVGIDLSPAQLARAYPRMERHPNLRFLEHDIMRVAELDEPPFDAGVCMDAACYLPDKKRALRAVAARLRSGAPLLWIDWCRAERVTELQKEMVVEPFYRYWAIPEMETVAGYERGFASAGFRLRETDDLSTRVALNWERGYQAAQRALLEYPTVPQLLELAAGALRLGPKSIRFLKDQFYAAVFAKLAADAGLLRYVLFVAERE